MVAKSLPNEVQDDSEKRDVLARRYRKQSVIESTFGLNQPANLREDGRAMKKHGWRSQHNGDSHIVAAIETPRRNVVSAARDTPGLLYRTDEASSMNEMNCSLHPPRGKQAENRRYGDRSQTHRNYVQNICMRNKV